MMQMRVPEEINALVRRISAAGDDRYQLHPDLARALDGMTARGFAVPSHLRRLEGELREEAMENTFENMPV